jgi:hypothetical protein
MHTYMRETKVKEEEEEFKHHEEGLKMEERIEDTRGTIGET